MCVYACFHIKRNKISCYCLSLTLYAVHYTLHTTRRTPHGICYTLYTIHILYTIYQKSVYDVYDFLYTVYWILHVSIYHAP